MHSSGMHSDRLLPVSPSMHYSGGVCSRGMCAPGDVSSGGVSAPQAGVVSTPGGCLPLSPSEQNDRCKTLPYRNFIADGKNIDFIFLTPLPSRWIRHW